MYSLTIIYNLPIYQTINKSFTSKDDLICYIRDISIIYSDSSDITIYRDSSDDHALDVTDEILNEIYTLEELEQEKEFVPIFGDDEIEVKDGTLSLGSHFDEPTHWDNLDF